MGFRELLKRAARFVACLAAGLVCDGAFANTPFGIMVGESFAGNDPPIAYLVGPDGTLTTPSGAGFPPFTGVLFSVAIAEDGTSLMGGVAGESFVTTSGDPPVAYLVSSSGSLTALSSPDFPGSGCIFSVAIANNGAGIIGGRSFAGDEPPLAYRVAPGGALTALSGLPDSGRINSVAIAESGVGIIGGQSFAAGQPPIAYLMATDGTLTPVFGVSFPDEDEISCVAIADSGIGIIGGPTHFDNKPPIAYRVAADGMLTTLSGGGFPQDQGLVNSVAIASSGAALMGGESFEGSYHRPTAYLLAPGETTLMALTGSGFPTDYGAIFSVAIAENGSGIMGGQSYDGTRPPIAYLISPEGVLQALSHSGMTNNGSIYSVAISESGVGLIGGVDFNGLEPPIAYLVAADGTLTPLSSGLLPDSGEIYSVAVGASGSAVSSLTPKSIGPYSSLTNALFALSHLFESHCTGRKKFSGNPSQAGKAMTADSGIHPQLQRQEFSKNAELESPIDTRQVPKKRPSWTAWTSFFGDYAKQGSQENIPAFSNEIVGALAALEYDGVQNVTVGGGLAYAFTYAHYGESLGHAVINQEYALVYAEFDKRHFYFNAALWGGLYQMHNKRHTLGFITSTSSPRGYLLSPHVELSAPFNFAVKGHSLSADPFVMIDWANSWQRAFRERGEAGFNIALNSQYSSLLRSEAGVRFLETIQFDWGCLKLEEKGSYVNKAPFHTGAGTAIFVGAVSSFGIETFSSSIQNLGALQMAFYFTPWNTKYPYGSLDYQGEFGSSFQSHILLLEIGKSF